MQKIAVLFITVMVTTFAVDAIAQQPPRVKPIDLEVVESTITPAGSNRPADKLAEKPASKAAPLAAPALPPSPTTKEAETDEPKVVVVKKDGETLEEYRVRGKLVKTRVTPASGPAYFLVDLKGDGNFVRSDGPEQKGAVSMWTIFEW